VERRRKVDVETAEATARRKIEEILDFFTALGHAGKVAELRAQLQVLAWVKWESGEALIKIRNPEGKCA
jgi:hypothetical protein